MILLIKKIVVFIIGSLLMCTAVYAQAPHLEIVYKNADAFNGYDRSPDLRVHLDAMDGLKMMRGIRYSTLRLHGDYSVYTVDSLKVSDVGRHSRHRVFSIVNLRNRKQQKYFSVYPDTPVDEAYEYKHDWNGEWKIAKDSVRTILGMSCYYAIRYVPQWKQTFQIWFTNDLPHRDGPFPSNRAQTNLSLKLPLHIPFAA